MSCLQRLRIVVVLVELLTLQAFATGAKFASEPTSGSSDSGDYFEVSPAIAAPGQFIEFSWHVDNATSFSVTPSLAGEDGIPLPGTLAHYSRVAPAANVTFQGIGSIAAGGVSQPLTAALTVIPMRLTASTTVVAAGQRLTLTYAGPNNGSSFFLTTLPENSTVPLNPDSCSGSVCTGSYLTGPLGSNKTFMVGATGPHNGQAYSQQIAISVIGG